METFILTLPITFLLDQRQQILTVFGHFQLLTQPGKLLGVLSGALAAMLDLGKGSGPMNHAFALQGEYAKEARE